MRQGQNGRPSIRPPEATEAMKRFGRYKQELRRAKRERKVEGDRVLLALRRAWNVYDGMNHEMGDPPFFYGDGYFEAISTFLATNPIGHRAADVERFASIIDELREDMNFEFRAGLFLSALINSCVDNHLSLDLSRLEWPLESIGRDNTKTIHVRGDVGDRLGEFMDGGRITVDGDLYGQIIMYDGEIHLNGECYLSMYGKPFKADIDDSMILGGRVYLRGILVVDR